MKKKKSFLFYSQYALSINNFFIFNSIFAKKLNVNHFKRRFTLLFFLLLIFIYLKTDFFFVFLLYML